MAHTAEFKVMAQINSDGVHYAGRLAIDNFQVFLGTGTNSHLIYIELQTNNILNKIIWNRALPANITSMNINFNIHKVLPLFLGDA